MERPFRILLPLLLCLSCVTAQREKQHKIAVQKAYDNLSRNDIRSALSSFQETCEGELLQEEVDAGNGIVPPSSDLVCNADAVAFHQALCEKSDAKACLSAGVYRFSRAYTKLLSQNAEDVLEKIYRHCERNKNYCAFAYHAMAWHENLPGRVRILDRLCSGDVKDCIQTLPELRIMQDFSENARAICGDDPRPYCGIAALHSKGAVGEGYSDYWMSIDRRICDKGRQGIYQSPEEISFAGVACMSLAEKYVVAKDGPSAMPLLLYACQRGGVPGACDLLSQMEGKTPDATQKDHSRQPLVEKYLAHLAMAAGRGASHVLVNPASLSQCRPLGDGEYLCPEASVCPISEMQSYLKGVLEQKKGAVFAEILALCETGAVSKNFIFKTSRLSGPLQGDISLRRGEDRSIVIGLHETSAATWVDLGTLGQ